MAVNRDALMDIRPVVSSPKEFYDRLVAASLEGRLPARGKAPDGTGYGQACRYMTARGEQCGIGLLFSPEDAARLQGANVGSVMYDKDLFDAILPGWLSFDHAHDVQKLHDGMLPWSHDEWVAGLKRIPVFHGVA